MRDLQTPLYAAIVVLLAGSQITCSLDHPEGRSSRAHDGAGSGASATRLLRKQWEHAGEFLTLSDDMSIAFGLSDGNGAYFFFDPYTGTPKRGVPSLASPPSNHSNHQATAEGWNAFSFSKDTQRFFVASYELGKGTGPTGDRYRTLSWLNDSGSLPASVPSEFEFRGRLKQYEIGSGRVLFSVATLASRWPGVSDDPCLRIAILASGELACFSRLAVVIFDSVTGKMSRRIAPPYFQGADSQSQLESLVGYSAADMFAAPELPHPNLLHEDPAGWKAAVAHPTQARINIFSGKTMRVVHTIAFPDSGPICGNSSDVHGGEAALAMTKDGHYLASYSSHIKRICVFDTESGLPAASIGRDDTFPINTISFSPDGTSLIVAGTTSYSVPYGSGHRVYQGSPWVDVYDWKNGIVTDSFRTDRDEWGGYRSVFMLPTGDILAQFDAAPGNTKAPRIILYTHSSR